MLLHSAPAVETSVLQGEEVVSGLSKSGALWVILVFVRLSCSSREGLGHSWHCVFI